MQIPSKPSFEGIEDPIENFLLTSTWRRALGFFFKTSPVTVPTKEQMDSSIPGVMILVWKVFLSTSTGPSKSGEKFSSVPEEGRGRACGFLPGESGAEHPPSN